VTATVTIERGYPVTINDDEVAAEVGKIATELLGDDQIVVDPTPIKGAEDWSYVLQQVPGVMVFLGSCPMDLEPGAAPVNHSNLVCFDE
jgi:hippurate hydrolase